MKPPNAESIEQRVINLERALSTALLNAGRLARVVEEQSARIESLEGANVKRDSESEPDAEPPYRMTEPENVGAVVVSEGLRYVRIESQREGWTLLGGTDWCEWADIDNPQPFQNVTLTAEDPEPPVGSVVRDDHCGSYERIDSGPLGWRSSRSGYSVGWADIVEAPVTLLYRGEA